MGSQIDYQNLPVEIKEFTADNFYRLLQRMSRSKPIDEDKLIYRGKNENFGKYSLANKKVFISPGESRSCYFNIVNYYYKVMVQQVLKPHLNWTERSEYDPELERMYRLLCSPYVNDKELPWNQNVRKKDIFEVLVKRTNGIDSSPELEDIPLGGIYIKLNYTRRFTKEDGSYSHQNVEDTGQIFFTSWVLKMEPIAPGVFVEYKDAEGKYEGYFERSEKVPKIFFEQDNTDDKLEKRGNIRLRTYEWLYSKTIEDTLNQMMWYKSGKPQLSYLTRATNSLVAKVKMDLGCGEGYMQKIAQTVYFIPLNEKVDSDGEFVLINNGRYTFNPLPPIAPGAFFKENASYTKKSFGDIFAEKTKFSLQSLKRIVDKFKLGLLEESPASLNRGKLVISNLNFLRAIKSQDVSLKDSIYPGEFMCYLPESSKTMDFLPERFLPPILSLYLCKKATDLKKTSERHRTLYTTNVYPFVKSNVYKSLSQFGGFHRNLRYLPFEGKVDFKKEINESINILVVFGKGDDTFDYVTEENYRNFSDNEFENFSRTTDGVECSPYLSVDIANQEVKAQRSMSFRLTKKHLTSKFKEHFTHFENNRFPDPIRLKSHAYDSEGIKIKTEDFIIGHSASCPDCDNLLFAADKIVEPINLEENIVTYTESDYPLNKETKHFVCSCCGFAGDQDGSIKVKKNVLDFKHKTNEIIITKMSMIDDETETDQSLEIKVEIYCNFDHCRVVCRLGSKAVMTKASDDIVGIIKYAEIPNPDGGDPFIIENVKADAYYFPGNFKGQKNGLAMSAMMLSNALFDNAYCFNEDIEKHKDKAFPDLNKYLKTIKPALIERVVYDPETQSMIKREEECFIGMLSVSCSEIADEFIKTKTIHDPMTISSFNKVLLNQLGMDDVVEVFERSSVFNGKLLIEQAENDGFTFDTVNAEFHESFVELMKLYYNYTDDLQDYKHSHAIFKMEENEKIPLFNLMSKVAFQDVLAGNKLFSDDERFKHGFLVGPFSNPKSDSKKLVYYRMPSQKLLNSLKLVSNLGGNKVKLDPFITHCLESLIKIGGLDFKQIEGRKSYPSFPSDELKKRQKCTRDLVLGKKKSLSLANSINFPGFSAKQTKCSLLPSGTVVVGDSFGVKKIKDDFIRRSVQLIFDEEIGEYVLFGYYHRDPVVFATQPMFVRILTVHQANILFEKTYGDKNFQFPDPKENRVKGTIRFTDIHPEPKGIFCSPLDMVFRQQSDVDGDLGRLPVPPTTEGQKIIQEKWKLNLFHNFWRKYNKEDAHYMTAAQALTWGFDYFIDEYRDTYKEYFLRDDNDNPYLNFDATDCAFESVKRVQTLFDIAETKSNVAFLTTSLWHISHMLEYNLALKENSSVFTEKALVQKEDGLSQVTEMNQKEKEDIKNAILTFYQNVFVQDGTVRALKKASELGKATHDNIAKNIKIKREISENKTVLIDLRDVVLEYAVDSETKNRNFSRITEEMTLKEKVALLEPTCLKETGYLWCYPHFMNLMDWWLANGGFKLSPYDGQWKTSKEDVTEDGAFIKATITSIYGQSYSSLGEVGAEKFFKTLINPNAFLMKSYRIFTGLFGSLYNLFKKK